MTKDRVSADPTARGAARPTVAPRPPDPPGSTIVHVALALGLVRAAVSAPLMMIGIADSRSSSSFAPGLIFA